jgi:hypothetical protein
MHGGIIYPCELSVSLFGKIPLEAARSLTFFFPYYLTPSSSCQSPKSIFIIANKDKLVLFITLFFGRQTWIRTIILN